MKFLIKFAVFEQILMKNYRIFMNQILKRNFKKFRIKL